MRDNSLRRAAVVPMFAILLPVIAIISFIAINIAYMQLTKTELKIAADAAARAGSRAMSDSQNLTVAIQTAQDAGQLNSVAGQPLVLSINEADNEIVIGSSERQDVNGRYDFETLTQADVDAGSQPNAMRINASLTNSLLFAINGQTDWMPTATSVAAQVDRDIALVVDRSGSMAYFYDEDFLFEHITALHEDASNGITQAEYDLAVADYQGATVSNNSLRDREYVPSILNLLTGDLRVYAETLNSEYRSQSAAPTHSSWDLLEQAMEVFFDTLELTDQIEQVSVASFNSNAESNLTLTTDLDTAENSIVGLYPTGGTAIGDGLTVALPTLSSSNSRPFAVKTVVIFTDGVNRSGSNPAQVAMNVLAMQPDLIIHTVTFSDGADITAMRQVAAAGNGRHYHANDGERLKEIFREIAATVPTIITE